MTKKRRNPLALLMRELGDFSSTGRKGAVESPKAAPPAANPRLNLRRERVRHG
jgi:hypothetical protein